MVPEEGAQAFAEQTGWHVATPEQREYGAKLLESGGLGQQALAAGETAIRTGTLGLVPGLAGGWQQRAEIQREEHPYIAGASQALGALAPALLTGGAAGVVGGAAGLGRVGLGVAGAVGEGLAGGLAEEVEQARAETRDVSAGNILLYGLGGEIVGRALPKALAMGAGKVRRALSAVDEVAGEGVSSALAGAEARSVETEARLARDLPAGPERQAALERTAKQQYDRMAPEAAADLDGIIQAAGEMGETSGNAKVVERLKQAMPDEAPAQQNFFTEAKQRLDQARRKMREPLEAPGPATKSPVSLEGKSLEDLRALPIEDESDLARVANLKTNTEFQKTGRVKSNDGAHGITLVDDGGDLVLRDGRHRLLAAQELERDTIWGRLVDGKTGKEIYQGEIPLKKLSAKAPSLADAPGLGGFAKRVDQIIGDGLKRLDKSASAVDQFLISRDIKQQLQGVSKKMGLVKEPQEQLLHDQMHGLIDESWRAIRDGLADESLFGGAAKIERDINGAWTDKVAGGLNTTERDLARKVDVDPKTGRSVYEADPGKMRAFLKSDRVDRAITSRKLDDVLDGAEDMVRAHEVHGTWDPKKLAEQRQRIARLRETRQFADEIQVAQATKAERAAAAPASVADKLKAYGKAEALDYAAEHVASLLPYGGQIYRLGKRVLGIDQAARSATKQTARRLAGTAAATAETGLGTAASLAPVPTMTALARFTGEYSGPEESFEAKKKILDAEQVSPEALYEAIGASLEDLPKVNPGLFQQIAARTAEKVRYCRANLPPGIQTTLMYPNGTPPSQSAMREFATMWNTVMDPHSVLEDIATGTATGQQMKHLQQSDPDLYEQLRGDVVSEIGANFRSVPLSTKLQLDILFNADGLAGPFFSSKAGDMIGQSLKDDQARGQPAGAMAEPSKFDQGDTGAGPGGLTAIQNSVTNRGGGA
jgi:hypothetical protein